MCLKAGAFRGVFFACLCKLGFGQCFGNGTEQIVCFHSAADKNSLLLVVVKSTHTVGQLIDRLNRHRLFVNESAEQSPCVVGNRRLRPHAGSSLRNVIHTLNVVGNADTAVVTGVLAVGFHDFDRTAKFLPLDIHALIAPKILVAQSAGVGFRRQNQQGVGSGVVTEICLHIQIVTELAAVCAYFLGGSVGKSVNLVTLSFFLCRPSLFVKIFGLRGGFKNIVKIAHC